MGIISNTYLQHLLCRCYRLLKKSLKSYEFRRIFPFNIYVKGWNILQLMQDSFSPNIRNPEDQVSKLYASVGHLSHTLTQVSTTMHTFVHFEPSMQHSWSALSIVPLIDCSFHSATSLAFFPTHLFLLCMTFQSICSVMNQRYTLQITYLRNLVYYYAFQEMLCK